MDLWRRCSAASTAAPRARARPKTGERHKKILRQVGVDFDPDSRKLVLRLDGGVTMKDGQHRMHAFKRLKNISRPAGRSRKGKGRP